MMGRLDRIVAVLAIATLAWMGWQQRTSGPDAPCDLARWADGVRVLSTDVEPLRATASPPPPRGAVSDRWAVDVLFVSWAREPEGFAERTSAQHLARYRVFVDKGGRDAPSAPARGSRSLAKLHALQAELEAMRREHGFERGRCYPGKGS